MGRGPCIFAVGGAIRGRRRTSRSYQVTVAAAKFARLWILDWTLVSRSHRRPREVLPPRAEPSATLACWRERRRRSLGTEPQSMSKQAPAPAPAPAQAPPPAYGKAAMVDLVDEIDWSACEVLNATGSLQNVLKQGLRDQEGLLLESDADEQATYEI